MRLIVAEKKSVADAIKDCLARPVMSGNGVHIAQDGTHITWLSGHMMTLFEPHDYDALWKKWSVEHLPILPKSFQYKPLEEPRITKQLRVVVDLMKRATEVVNAGDPDREGNLLVMEVVEHAQYKGKLSRFIAGSQDTATVRTALKAIKPYDTFRLQLDAAKARSWGDWLVGMNCSRAATKLLANNSLVSVGRVQTPVLGMVVKRDRAIEGFKQRNYFEIAATVRVGSTEVVLRFNPQDEALRIWDKAVAETLATSLRNTTVTVSVISEQAREAPPKLHTLGTFQQWANKQQKWSATKSLEILQSLYERKASTYPRTDIDALPEEHIALIPATLIAAATHVVVPEGIAAEPTIRKSTYNSKKVVEHHALAPTTDASALNGIDEKQLCAYKEVALRYVLNLMPDCEYTATRMSFTSDKQTFSATGRIVTARGWQAHRDVKPTADKELPAIEDSAEGVVVGTEVFACKTSPPEPYTEALLLADMMAAHKFVTNPMQAAILKSSKGLGTSATRAAILDELKVRSYIEVIKGKVRATPFGCDVIDALPAALSDPALTAIWEMRFGQIEEGELELSSFIDDLSEFIVRNIDAMKSAPRKIANMPTAKAAKGN